MPYPEAMNEEDLINAKGRTLAEYSQCKDRLATLNAEADHVARLLEAVSKFLRNESDRYATGELEQVFTPRTRALIEDLHQTRDRLSTLQRLLKDMRAD